MLIKSAARRLDGVASNDVLATARSDWRKQNVGKLHMHMAMLGNHSCTCNVSDELMMMEQHLLNTLNMILEAA